MHCGLPASRDQLPGSTSIDVRLAHSEDADVGIIGDYWWPAGDPQANCTPGPALPGLLAQYVTPGAGQLACSQGADVTYPPAAPGFAYDPTGSSNASVRICSQALAEEVRARVQASSQGQLVEAGSREEG